MRETRPLCFSCGFAEGLHVHEVRDDGEECVAWPDMDDFNAGFAALRSEVAALREALEPFAAYGRCVDPHVYDDAPIGNNIKPYLTFVDVRRAAAALSRPALTGNGGKP